MAVVLLAGCGSEAHPAGWVDERRLAEGNPENWYTIHGGLSGNHYSPLDTIDRSNVSALGFAWEYATGTTRGLQASPVVVDGVMYTSGNWGVVYAVDARAGRQLWRFDPEVPGYWGRRPCCDIVNRGVAVWKGKVYVGALDGRLIALDAATGRKVWERDTAIDPDRYQVITGAPQIAGNKVVIGNSGAELGVRGYVTAYHVDTGEFAWRFFTVPGDPSQPFEHPELEMAAKTWDPESMWEVGGGGTVWDAMAYDPALNLLYVGVGNGSPHPIYSRSPRGGDNLFLSSILAINPDTGRLVWHYQTTPGETWDYTATQNMILTDLEVQGRSRKVLLQAPKNGFFYVLDRTTGELLSAEKYSRVTWASHVDMVTGRPVLTEQADFSDAPKLLFPGQTGAHMWEPMSYSPKAGLVYIPMLEYPMVYSYLPAKEYAPGVANTHVKILYDDTPEIAAQRSAFAAPGPKVFLQAWDPQRRQEAWRVQVEHFENCGGVLSTAGDLVFQGDAGGYLRVYAAKTGQMLKEIFVGTGIMAAPISYMLDGEQYVSVMAGVGGSNYWTYPKRAAARRYGNDGRIVTFKLGGTSVPLPKQKTYVWPKPPVVRTTPAMVERGRRLFDEVRCSWCHGVVAEPGILPDMLSLTAATHAIFKKIVLDGVYESKGMAGFSDVLSESDVEAIQAYVVHEANQKQAWLRTAEEE